MSSFFGKHSQHISGPLWLEQLGGYRFELVWATYGVESVDWVWFNVLLMLFLLAISLDIFADLDVVLLPYLFFSFWWITMYFFYSLTITNFAEVSEMSSRLTSESRIYADKAKDLNRQVSFIICVEFVREFYSNQLIENLACLIWLFVSLSVCNECVLLPQILRTGSCCIHYTHKLLWRSMRFPKKFLLYHGYLNSSQFVSWLRSTSTLKVNKWKSYIICSVVVSDYWNFLGMNFKWHELGVSCDNLKISWGSLSFESEYGLELLCHARWI